MLGVQELTGGDIALIITAIGGLLGSLGAFIVVLVKLGRSERKLDKTHEAVENVYEHVNNVDCDDGIPETGQPTTLGQAVRQLRDEQRVGFARNDTDHSLLRGNVEGLGLVVRGHATGIEDLRREVHEHGRRLLAHERRLPRGRRPRDREEVTEPESPPDASAD